jgi:hypothetical protein
VGELGDLNRFVDTNALLLLAHLDGADLGSTTASGTAASPGHLAASALGLMPLFSLLAL